jgi:hypothetical protein
MRGACSCLLLALALSGGARMANALPVAASATPAGQVAALGQYRYLPDMRVESAVADSDHG